MNIKGFGKAAAVLVATGALFALGTGMASAATPGPSGSYPSAATPAIAHTVLGKSSTGIWLYNNSADNLVLQSVSGDNAGVPAVGSELQSGVGHQDFEVVFRAAKTTTVTATYQVQDATGADIGTATVKLWNNAVGMTGVNSSFSSSTGGSLPLETAYINNTGNYEVQANTATTNTIDASSAQAASLVQQYCNNANNSATCTFTSPTKSPKPVSTTQEKLLVSGYTEGAPNTSPSNISVSAGYDDQTSTSTGSGVSVGLKLGKVLSLGVSQSWGQTLSFDHTFTSSESYQVDPGFTGYIWGEVPVLQYTGTMVIQVGNTTWDITNFTVTSPDAGGSLTSYSPASYAGYFPIGTPNQPPASA
jgi:hypothetical protein